MGTTYMLGQGNTFYARDGCILRAAHLTCANQNEKYTQERALAKTLSAFSAFWSSNNTALQARTLLK